ncbi:RidA family protein [Pelagovum pacificum]|uniref:RidA family protein n=1 Tax=Pelagovum pacificum TaxID=2588711 RepID=A0A5C5GI37_9RHOB|nr:RidA family protein [Pelagovum pacificum]QQA42609.1 RidA family protein [Pelagovum pacificum]TNY34240.1 RidA family protein [Pelagovum pacificum]
MSGNITSRLAELGVTLPEPKAPDFTYVPYVITGNLIFVSGQVSILDGTPIKGTLGDDMTVEQGAEAAKACAISMLSHVKSALDGDLSRVKRVVKLLGFVNSTPDFTDQPQVINGASDFLVDVFGDTGRHARSAVSAGALPMGFAVEIEGIFEFE